MIISKLGRANPREEEGQGWTAVDVCPGARVTLKMDLVTFSILSVCVMFGMFMLMYVVICVSLCRDSECCNF